MHEYIVTVHKLSDWDQLWDQLTIDGRSDAYVPTRAVEVVNERPFNDYSAHFNLTHEEAEHLAKDARVVAVEQQADQQEDVFKHFHEIRPGTYDRNEKLTVASMKNWGLVRSITRANPFGASTAITTNNPYCLDGTGVDIIIMDSGVEANHPELAVNADGTGGSRVVDFDWSSLHVPGIPSGASIGGYFGDSDGHGTNVASIAAGNTCGWAPGAAIYTIRIFGGTDITTGAPLQAINSDLAYDLIKAFHLAKIAAGNTRPTIVNSSWAYSSSYDGIQSTVYRGKSYPTKVATVAYGQVTATHPIQVAYVDTSVNSCSAAGVVLVGAAGNNSHKIDLNNGLDYNNYYVKKSPTTGRLTNTYYHRGSSPASAPTMISVGAHGFITNTIEGKAYFSCSGPRVDIYAPGVMIMGAYANKHYVTDAVADPRAAGFYLNKVTGTSQASPQVCGALACILQSRPTMSYNMAKLFLIDNCTPGALDEATWAFAKGTTFGNTYMLQGGNNRILYQPFFGANRGVFYRK